MEDGRDASWRRRGTTKERRRECRRRRRRHLVLLPTERASFREAGFAAGGLAKHRRAAGADDHRLSVAEHRRDLVAAGALDIHEVRVGRLHESLQLAFAFLFFDGRVKEIFRERHSSSLSVRSCWGKISTKKFLKLQEL